MLTIWHRLERSGSNEHELFCEYFEVVVKDPECTPNYKQEDVLNILTHYTTLVNIDNGVQVRKQTHHYCNL